MLATLLRWILLVQMCTGALLANMLLGAKLGAQLGAFWASALGAFLGPVGWVAVGTLVSCAVSRARNEPAALWRQSVWGEFKAGLRAFVLRQPWTLHPPALLAATAPGVCIPVVLVHGYLCNHRIWDDVAATLRAQGHSVQAVNLEPLFGSIDDYAPTIEAAVQALVQHTGHQQVALVGHSMGGLAIRAWMRSHGTQRVARVMTLGTPHAGTRLAKGSTTVNGKQMLWRSAWLAALAAHETQATRDLMHIAITPQDNIVCPQRAQTLAGIQPTVFEGIGHLQMCTHPPVLQWLVQQLNTPAQHCTHRESHVAHP
jgi:triacylglycerol lipase